MTRVLVVHGAGMNMRGKAQLELFGPDTLEQINEKIRGYADTLGVDVEIFHSNIVGEVINALYDAQGLDFDGALINPAGFTTSTGPLPNAISQVRYPVIEVHVTNPTARGITSVVQPVCKGSIYGFGIYGYYIGLEVTKHLAGS